MLLLAFLLAIPHTTPSRISPRILGPRATIRKGSGSPNSDSYLVHSKRVDECECCNPAMRRREAVTRYGLMGAAAAVAGPRIIDFSRNLATPGSFAWCMANRMGSYEMAVRQEKAKYFRALLGSLGISQSHKSIKGTADRKQIMEIGIGPGPNMPLYRSEGAGLQFDVTGLDSNPFMQQYAEKSANAAGVPFRFVSGDAGKLPFEDDSFDAVVSTHVLCSVPNPSLAIKEIARVLKPGGVYMFWEHVRAPKSDVALGFQQDLLDPMQTALFQGCHLNRDSLGAVRRSGVFRDVDANEFYIGDRFLLAPHAAGIALV